MDDYNIQILNYHIQCVICEPPTHPWRIDEESSHAKGAVTVGRQLDPLVGSESHRAVLYLLMQDRIR